MATTESLSRQVTQIEEKLNHQLEKAKRAQTTSIIVGVVLAIIIFAYFFFISTLVAKFSSPQDMAGIAALKIKEQFKAMKPELEKEARQRAPELVDGIVNNAVKEQLPHLRSQLEGRIKKEIDASYNPDKLSDELVNYFNVTMDQNEDKIRAMVATLKEPDGQKKYEQQMYELIHDGMAAQQLIVDLDSYGTALEDIHARLVALAETPESEMSESEVATKNLIMVVRELADRSKLDPDKLIHGEEEPAAADDMKMDDKADKKMDEKKVER